MRADRGAVVRDCEGKTHEKKNWEGRPGRFVGSKSKLRKSGGAEVEVGAAGAVDAVLAAARAHPGIPSLSLPVVVAVTLRSLAAVADNRRAVVDSEGGGVALLVELLGSHSCDAVEVHAVIALELLSAGGLIGSGKMTGQLRHRLDAVLTRVISEGVFAP